MSLRQKPTQAVDVSDATDRLSRVLLSGLERHSAETGATSRIRGWTQTVTRGQHNRAIAVLAYNNLWDKVINASLRRGAQTPFTFNALKIMDYVGVFAFFCDIEALRRRFPNDVTGEASISVVQSTDAQMQGLQRPVGACHLRLQIAGRSATRSNEIARAIAEEMIRPAHSAAGNQAMKELWRHVVTQLMSALQYAAYETQSGWIRYTTYLYRGINGTGMDVNTVLREMNQTYSSASDKYSVAMRFAASSGGAGRTRWILQLEVEPGIKVISVDAFLPTGWRCYADEREYILVNGAAYYTLVESTEASDASGRPYRLFRVRVTPYAPAPPPPPPPSWPAPAPPAPAPPLPAPPPPPPPNPAAAQAAAAAAAEERERRLRLAAARLAAEERERRLRLEAQRAAEEREQQRRRAAMEEQRLQLERQRRREEAEAREAREAAEAEAREAAEAEARAQAAEREAFQRDVEALLSQYRGAMRSQTARNFLLDEQQGLRHRLTELVQKLNNKVREFEAFLNALRGNGIDNVKRDLASLEQERQEREQNGTQPFMNQEQEQYRNEKLRTIAVLEEEIRIIEEGFAPTRRRLAVAKGELEFAGGEMTMNDMTAARDAGQERQRQDEKRKAEEASRRFVKEKQKAEKLERMERESKAGQQEREMREARVFTKAEWRALPDLEFVNNTMVKIPSIYGDVVMRYKAKDGKFYILGPE